MNSKTRFQLSIWSVVIGVVYALGVYFYMKEFDNLRVCEALYYSLRLFVFEGETNPFPSSWQLRFLYFLAPVLAASAAVNIVVTFIFRLPPLLWTLFISDHVVICGIGRTGRIIAEALRQERVPVVGVDLGPSEKFDDWCSKYRIPMIFGDFNSQRNHVKAKSRRARAVLFTSGDDLINLEGALSVYETLRNGNGSCHHVWTHIADEHLVETARGALRTDSRVKINFFDTYHIAASKMVAGYFGADRRQGISEIHILGFGKFGRDLLEVIVKELKPGENISISVIDKEDRESDVRELADAFGASERVMFRQAAIQHLELGGHENNAFFLCTDDDLGNLAAAMMLAKNERIRHVYVRMTRWPIPAIADQLGEDRGVVFVNIRSLVTMGIRELPGIFKPAGCD